MPKALILWNFQGSLSISQGNCDKEFPGQVCSKIAKSNGDEGISCGNYGQGSRIAKGNCDKDILKAIITWNCLG